MRVSQVRRAVCGVLAVGILTGPWLLALLSHVPGCEPMCRSAYRGFYSPLFAVVAPFGDPLEYSALWLATPAMRRHAELSRPRVMDRTLTQVGRVLQIAIVAVLGGSIGSFLNVVVYRMPRGIGLLKPGSHCPACGASIRPLDNIPVIGWLKLRGRCRSCRSPISVRYPLVEAGLTALFLVLAWFELYEHGANLPRVSGRMIEPDLASFETNLIWIFLYHTFALVVLLGVALMRMDGFDPPPRFAWPSLIVALLAPFGYSPLQPLPALAAESSGLPPWAATLSGCALGVAVGAVFAMIIHLGQRRSSDGAKVDAAIAFAFTFAGAILGWQAITTIGVGLAVCLAVASWQPGRKWQTEYLGPALFFIAASAHILFWSTLAAQSYLPGPASGVGALVIAFILAAVAALIRPTNRRSKCELPPAPE